MGNWADLPPEIIDLIASRVFQIDHFSLVCKSWNNVVASTNSVPICLMNYCRRTQKWKFLRHDCSFFMSFPQLEDFELKDAEILCSKYGWLLMARSGNTLFFFNPASNETIYLQCKIGRGYTTVTFIHPPTSPDCLVVGIRNPNRFQGVGICILELHGEHVWETKEYPTDTRFLLSHEAPVWHRGQIYFLDVKGNVARFDIINRHLLVTSDESLMIQQDDKIKERYLFKLRGEVCGAFVFHDEGKVKVFRLLARKRKQKITKLTWELVDDIGHNVVYLSHKASLSFRCTAHTNVMANRIYFPKFHGDSAVFYSFSDAKYHSLNGVFSVDNAIGLKHLDKAAWVMPAAAPVTTTSELTTENS